MSETTFSSPTTATGGLQAYDLEQKPKNLYPAPPISGSQRSGLTAAARLKQRLRAISRHTMRKDAEMDDTLKAMVGTLSKSVIDIHDKGGDEAGALLTRSIGEFETAIAARVGEIVDAALVKVAPATDGFQPLFKGLGAVGDIADLLRLVSSRVDSLKKSGDGVPEDAETMLDMMVGAGEMALRHAVNDHVELPDENDDPDDMPGGMTLIAVPSMLHPDDPSHATVVKTMLPEDLAKFATDPDALREQAVTFGAEMMVAAGVPEEALTKAFGLGSGDDLAKAAGAPPAAAGGAPGAAGPGADDGSDPGDSSDDPLTVLGRLLAAAMIQLDHIQQLVGESGDGSDADPNADPNADPGTDPNADPNADPGADPAATGEGVGVQPAPAPGADPAKKKPPFGKSADAGDLQKVADDAAELVKLRGDMASMTKRLASLEAQPMPAKGVVNATVALSKGVDTGGVDTGAALDREAQRIAALPADRRDEELTRALAKRALSTPVPMGAEIPGALGGLS